MHQPHFKCSMAILGSSSYHTGQHRQSISIMTEFYRTVQLLDQKEDLVVFACVLLKLIRLINFL
jgi:hypothetical protein